jgi:hypothetical protein
MAPELHNWNPKPSSPNEPLKAAENMKMRASVILILLKKSLHVCFNLGEKHGRSDY